MFKTEVQVSPRHLARASNFLTVTLRIISKEFESGQFSCHWMALRKRVGTEICKRKL